MISALIFVFSCVGSSFFNAFKPYITTPKYYFYNITLFFQEQYFPISEKSRVSHCFTNKPGTNNHFIVSFYSMYSDVFFVLSSKMFIIPLFSFFIKRKSTFQFDFFFSIFIVLHNFVTKIRIGFRKYFRIFRLFFMMYIDVLVFSWYNTKNSCCNATII